MPTFHYTAKDRNGQSVQGQIQAPSESTAAAQIRERGMFVLRIQRAASPPGEARVRESLMLRVLPPVGIKQRMQLWRQLHSTFESGVSVSQGLSLVSHSANSHLGKVLREASRRTSEGEALSAVLVEYPASFPRAEVALIRAGEQGGTLSEAINALAAMNEAELELRRMYIFQSAYPVVALILAALVLALVWNGPGGALDILERYHLPVILGLIILFFGTRALFASVPSIKQAWDHLKLRMPGTGGLVARLSTAKAANVIAAGYRSGLDIALSLELAAESCGNAAMEKKIMDAVPLVRKGESPTAALAKSGAMPTRALQFLETGERTGNIDGMMTSLSKYSREEAIAAMKLAAVVLGVAALVAVGGVVLFIALRFYGGMYDTMINGR